MALDITEAVAREAAEKGCGLILAHHPVSMVTDLCDHQMLSDMHMTPVNTIDEAFELAFKMKGADAKVAIIPDGLGVVVAQR